MELSIVLVNYNGAECLPETLEALARNTTAEEVEGFVVDSGSSDGSWDGSERWWEKARALRFEENIGFCAGCTEVPRRPGRLVAFVNFDAASSRGWDAPLRNAARANRGVGSDGLCCAQDG